MSALWLTLLLSASSLKHGTWVYKVKGQSLLTVDPRGAALLAFSHRHALTELYLSEGALPLADPRAPALVSALKSGGLRVEALLDEGELTPAIAAVIAYNRVQPAQARIDGIHYDLEPWTKSEAWVAPLVSAYRAGRTLAASQGMTFAADLSAVKFAHLTAEERAALREAASHVVLMAYEAKEQVVHQRCDALLAEHASGGLMIATWVKDFGARDRLRSPKGRCQNGAVLAALDTAYAASASYQGWATFSYNAYLEPSDCPGDCCALASP